MNAIPWPEGSIDQANTDSSDHVTATHPATPRTNPTDRADPDSSDQLTPGQPAASRTNRVRRVDRLAALEELRASQRGVIRRDQLRTLGWTRHHVSHEIAYGRWHQVAPEVIAMQNAPLIHDQRLWLGVLHAGPRSAVSHGTLLQISGLAHWESDVIDIISIKGNTVERLEGFFFHETRRDYQPWIHPTKAPPQLRVEEAALLAAERKRSPRSGIGLLAASVQQRITTAQRLLMSSFAISKLRHGHQFRLALWDIAGGAQSLSEIDVGQLCRDFGLRPPTRQRVRLDHEGRRRYLDCEWELEDGTVIILEIDGGFHLESEHWWRDMKRERGLVIEVGRVLRCSSIEIRLAPEAIAGDLRNAGVPSLN